MSMPAVLNDLEREILEYMVTYLRTHTYQPSIREIGEEFGIRSTKTVSEYLSALASKGYLERDPSRSRGIRILGVDLNPNTVSIPCYTELPASSRGFESDGVESWLSVDRRLGAARGAWFLKVREPRWQGFGIEAGDLLLVEPAGVQELKDGDLALLHLGERPDLYRVHRADRALRVQAVGDRGEALVVEDPARLVVRGRVAGLHRRFDETPLPISPTTH
jgi:repressor LexA